MSTPTAYEPSASMVVLSPPAGASAGAGGGGGGGAGWACAGEPAAHQPATTTAATAAALLDLIRSQSKCLGAQKEPAAAALDCGGGILVAETTRVSRP